jgi:hypothetical protein
VALGIAGTLYVAEDPSQGAEFPVIAPAAPGWVFSVSGKEGDEEPLHVLFVPLTEMLPPVKEDEKFTVILLVLLPEAMEAPGGKVHE